MLELISHIVEISSRRDRTEINSAMVDALLDLFHPERLVIYRCFSGGQKTVVFACAGAGADGVFIRNAYLPDRQYCQPIHHDPLLLRCFKERSAALEVLDNGSHRVVFPVLREEEPVYLIHLSLSDEFSADQRVSLMGLVEYFCNHIGLLDYGETDSLTGLSNRKTFDKHLFELLGQASEDARDSPAGYRREGQTGDHWLAVCDIDHFKRVNDTFGHLVGDEVLIMLSQVMRRSFRFDDHLFRFGGEEFIALLQPMPESAAQAALERFRQAVEELAFSRVGQITVSIGFSALRPGDTPTNAIDRADEALYHAKNHGRNQVACYEALVAAGALPVR